MPELVPDPASIEDDDEDVIPLSVLRDRLQLDPALTFDDFANVDDGVITSEEADNEHSQSTNVELISSKEAMERLRDLQRFFMSRENTQDGEFESLSKLETAILKQTVSFRQFCISDFFHAVDN